MNYILFALLSELSPLFYTLHIHYTIVNRYQRGFWDLYTYRYICMIYIESSATHSNTFGVDSAASDRVALGIKKVLI